MEEPERVAREYFAAIGRRDLDAARTHLAPQVRGTIYGIADLARADEVMDFFRGVFAAVPDLTFEVCRTVTEGDTVAVHWRATGTFSGEPWRGLQATGGRLDFQGVDVIAVRNGLIAANDAFADGLTIYRQLGALPEAGSTAEARLTGAVNARGRLARRAGAAPGLVTVADGVWLLRGGVPRVMNVYLLADDGGVAAFDTGVRGMADAILAAAAPLGGLRRVVLSHGHPDHRGSAPRLGVPILCHPGARAEAEGDGGRSYFDLSKLGIPGRWTLPLALQLWDGGPVQIADTVSAEVAGFEVVEIPGHAPGMIALVRDGLALTADAFYVVDEATGRPRPAHLPNPAFNLDHEQARESLRRLAALDLTVAWPGHGRPLRRDVRGELERAADG